MLTTRFAMLAVGLSLLLLLAHAAPVEDDRTRAKAMPIAHHGGKVLMVGSRTDAKKPLQLPRGKTQVGEGQYAASVRELHEETGVDGSHVQHYSGGFHGDDGGKPVYAHTMKLKSIPDKLTSRENRRVVAVPKAEVGSHLAGRPGMKKVWESAKHTVPDHR